MYCLRNGNIKQTNDTIIITIKKDTLRSMFKLFLIYYLLCVGIDDIKIDLPGKKVLVTTALSSDEILETIKKTGKTCQFLGTH